MQFGARDIAVDPTDRFSELVSGGRKGDVEKVADVEALVARAVELQDPLDFRPRASSGATAACPSPNRVLEGQMAHFPTPPISAARHVSRP
jgi:hypothetical protein